MNEETVSGVTGKTSSKKFLIFGIVAIAMILVVAVVSVMAIKKKESYRTLEVIECVGESSIYREEKEIAAYEGMKLRSGDTITVGEKSYIRMKFDDDKYVYLEGHALIKLIADGTKKDSRTIVDIELGTMITEVQNKLSDRSVYEINSPNTTMAIRGTITISKVEYDIPVIEDSTGGGLQIQKKDVFEYIIKKNKLGKYSEKNTTNKQGESAGTVLTPEEELQETTLMKVEEVFNTGLKVAVSSFVQEGKVELITYEKKIQNDGTAVLAAVKVPIEEGNGISAKVEEIIPVAIVSEIKTDDSGKITINRTEAVEEFLQDVVENAIEVQEVKTIEELKEVLSEEIVEAIQTVEELNLSINLNQGGISEVIRETQPVWNEMITSTPSVSETPTSTEVTTVTPSPSPTEVPEVTPTSEPSPSPTEVPEVTPTSEPSPSPTEVPTATPSPSPSPTKVPIVTPSPSPTEVPTATPSPSPSPTKVPIVTPSPSPSPTEVPTATPSPSPSPTKVPTATPSPSPSPTKVPTATPSPSPSPTEVPTATPSPSPTEVPTATPSPSLTPSPIPTELPVPTISPEGSGDSGGTGGAGDAIVSPTVSPTPEEVIKEADGFKYTVLMGDKEEESVVIKEVDTTTGTDVVIPEFVEVESDGEMKEIPVIEISQDAFSSCENLNSIQVSKPITGLADAINNATAGNSTLTELVVPASVVSSLTESTLSCLKKLEIIPLTGYAFSPSTDAQMLFRLEKCSVLAELIVPADLMPYIQFTALDYNTTKVDLSLTVVPGCDGSVVLPENISLYDANTIWTLCMDGVSLPETGFVFPGWMRTFISKKVEEIPDNPLTTDYYATETLILEDVKVIGDNAFSNFVELGVIEAPALVSRSTTAFHNTNLVPLTRDELSCTEKDGTIIITEINCPRDNNYYNFAVPNMIDGKTVTAISENAVITADGYIPYLYVSEQIETIGNNAFTNSSISWINIPGVKTIGSGAFSSSSDLYKVDTKVLVSIGNDAFSNCPNLHGIPAVPSWFDYTENTEGIVIDGFSAEGLKVEKVSIPTHLNGISVIRIADSAFSDSSNLKGIVIKSDCVIGDASFKNCDSLEAVRIEGICHIGEETFFDCDKLWFVEGRSVSTIGKSAFESCDSLKTATLNNAKTIGESAFKDCVKLPQFVMNPTTAIGNYAFYNCSSLNIVLGDYLATVGIKALSGIANKRLFVPKNTEFAADSVGDNIILYTVAGAKILESPEYSCEILPGSGRILSHGGMEYMVYNEDVMEAVLRQVTLSAPSAMINKVDGVNYYFLVQYTSLSEGVYGFLSKAALEGSFRPEEWSQSFPSVSMSYDKFTTIYIRAEEPSTGTIYYYASDMMTNADISPYEYSDNDFRYTIYPLGSEEVSEGYAVVTECLNQQFTDIPTSVNGYTVTEIGSAVFENNDTIKQIVIPDTITKVGRNAFSGCSSLIKVESNSLETIAENAFKNCSSLRISLPDTVIRIESGALAGIANTRLYIPMWAEVAADAFGTETTMTIYAGSDARIATDENFADKVTIYEQGRIVVDGYGDALTLEAMGTLQDVKANGNIGASFDDASGVYCCVKVNEELDQESLEDEASGEQWTLLETNGVVYSMNNLSVHSYVIMYFKIPFGDEYRYYCTDRIFGSGTGLVDAGYEYTVNMTDNGGEAIITAYQGSSTDIVIPETLGGYPVAEIGERAFYDCDTVQFIKFPYGIKRISKDAFSECDRLVSVTVSGNIDRIETGAFRNCSLSDFTVIGKIGLVREGAFDSCSNLKEIDVNEIVTMESDAIRNCNNIIYYPTANSHFIYSVQDEVGTVTILGFTEGIDLTQFVEIRLPWQIQGHPVTVIGQDAFKGNETLERVIISDNTTVIGDGAFMGCTNLKSVYICNVRTIGANAFNGCSNLEVNLPSTVQLIGSKALSGIGNHSVFIPENAEVEIDSIDSTMHISTVTGSKFAVTYAYGAVSGSVYKDIEVKAPVARMVTDVAGVTFAGDYLSGLSETSSNMLLYHVSGIEAGSIVEDCRIPMAVDKYTLSREELEDETIVWSESGIIGTTNIMYFTSGSRLVVAVKITRPYGSVDYITSNVIQVP